MTEVRTESSDRHDNVDRDESTEPDERPTRDVVPSRIANADPFDLCRTDEAEIPF